MKTTLILLALLSGILLGEVRDWTDAKTQRTVTGEMLDKHRDNTKAQVRLLSGRTVWLETARLVEGDQEYVVDWVKLVKHLTIRVVAVKDLRKTVEVIAVAGKADIEVRAYSSPTDRSPEVTHVPKGESLTFNFTGSSKYKVEAWQDGIRVNLAS